MTTTPNTDAELTAWNHGARCAAVDRSYPDDSGGHADWREVPLTPAQRSACELLGPETFWLWVDRGYDAPAGVVRASASP